MDNQATKSAMLSQRKIQILMLQRGILTQEELARLIGEKPYELCKAIRGRRKDTTRIVKKLREFFGVKTKSLLEADPPPGPTKDEGAGVLGMGGS